MWVKFPTFVGGILGPGMSVGCWRLSRSPLSILQEGSPPMMGRTHALTGWCAGLAVAPLAGADTLAQVVVFAATTAGFALLPDLDHPGARASKLLGPLTGGISWLLRKASAGLYAVTKGPRDEDCKGTHRPVNCTFQKLINGVLVTGREVAVWRVFVGSWSRDRWALAGGAR